MDILTKFTQSIKLNFIKHKFKKQTLNSQSVNKTKKFKEKI